MTSEFIDVKGQIACLQLFVMIGFQIFAAK